MQEIHARRPCNSVGSTAPRVKSLMPARPPWRRTRANSRAEADLSGKVQKAHSQRTASKDASGKMQVLGVTGFEAHERSESFGSGEFVRLRNVLLAVVETDDMAGENFCQKQNAGALSPGNIALFFAESFSCHVICLDY